MSHAQRLDALEERLRPLVDGFGLELDAVLALKESGMQIVRVIVEAPARDAGVDSDLLADVSRAVSPIIDDVDPIDTEYFLEVSTPGVERELTEYRHWVKQLGRLVRVKLRDGRAFTGQVMSADDEGVQLDVEGTATRIDFVQVKKARARVEFGSEE